MAKVITFSRVFPSYHPRAGEPTYFEERVCRSIWDNKLIADIDEVFFPDIMKRFAVNVAAGYPPKHHTIRAGHRWKEGDWFSPRVWSGKPYNSKQIQFAPDIQIKKIWNFDVDPWESYVINSKPLCYSEFKAVALNDGFTAGDDLELWLNVKRGEAFNGQIICWNESINY
jgi:hypothetical protein